MDKPSNTQDELAWERAKWEREHSVPAKAAPKQEAPKKEAPPPPAVPSLKTLQNDIASNIRENKQSAVSIALARQERAQSQEGLTIGKDEPGSKKGIFVVLGTILVLAGISGFLFWTTPGRVLVGLEERQVAPSFDTPTTTPESLLVSSPISNQNKTVIDIADGDGLSFIKENLSGDTPAGILREVVIVSGDSRIKAPEFFSLWAQNIPQTLSRVIGGEFSLGAYGLSGDTPFLVFAVSRNDSAIAGMLSWEKQLPVDFSSLTGIPILTTPFVDKKVGDISVRAQSGGLLYTFPINGKVIIVGDESTLKKVREVFEI